MNWVMLNNVMIAMIAMIVMLRVCERGGYC